MMKGKLVVIDGLDGSGKTTQHKILVDSLKKMGFSTTGIEFPDYNKPAATLIKMYLAGEFGENPLDVNAYAASSFYSVERYASYKKYWKKNYEAGDVVVSARYTSSNLFHQMSKLPKTQWDEYIHWLTDYEYSKMSIPKPDLTLFLDMPLDVSKKLISQRYNGDETKRDIHEDNFKYLEKSRLAAHYAVKKMGFEIIQCSDGKNPLSVSEISEKILKKVLEIVYEK